MTEHTVSRSATILVRLRAAHQVLDADPKILVDPISVGFVPESSAEELRADATNLQHPMMRALRAMAVVRLRYVEDVLLEVAALGVRQYVNLGAGLDTFAYRQPAWASALTIFDVDRPDTQRWKQENLARLGIASPANLCWCPLSFEEQGLPEGLAAAGFDFMAPTCFAWLGVTPYLSNAAIEATLRFVLSLPVGSTIVFGFMLPQSRLTDEERAMMQVIIAGLASSGELALTEFEPSVLCDRLHTMGFSRVEHFSMEEANGRYFAGRSDGLRVLRLEETMWAAV
jgi:methyltransferase (TIGR00027 family)